MVKGRRLALVLSLAAVFGSSGSIARTPTLRILAVEGEDAINVIQQKTAVAPVVEVRDRNDQPLDGDLSLSAATNEPTVGPKTVSATWQKQ